MPKVKSLNAVVNFGGTPYIINDVGPNKQQRFELYDTKSKEVVAKSNNPMDFDEIVFGGEHDVSKKQTESDRKRKRRAKSATS